MQEESEENKLEKAVKKQQELIEKQEEQKSAEIQKASAQEAKENLNKSIGNLGTYLKELLNLNIGADKQGTISGIKKDIDFKGANVWILISSIFIASIGLNVNSTAVIIGAMLISPLMGPILGMGLALGTYDWEMLKRSLKSLGIAALVSILTAFIFFKISPLKELTSELAGRTSPNLYDAFIAVFGGIAGIIGVSRKEKTNVVPGVAIATALMPPLCTVGYGLAIGEPEYYLGAFYLFFLNSFFICMATFVIVRLLRIPVKEFLDPKRERTVKRSLLVFTVLILASSGYLFYHVAKKSRFESNARTFITEDIGHGEEDIDISNHRIVYSDSVPRIDIVLVGEFVGPAVIQRWQRKLNKYKGLETTRLNVIQGEDIAGQVSAVEGKLESIKTELVQEVYKNIEDELDAKKKEISSLKAELQYIKEEELPYKDISRDLLNLYPQILRMSLGRLHITEGDIVKEIPTFIFLVDEWEAGELFEDKEQIEKYLKGSLGLTELDVIIQISKEGIETDSL